MILVNEGSKIKYYRNRKDFQNLIPKIVRKIGKNRQIYIVCTTLIEFVQIYGKGATIKLDSYKFVVHES